MSCQVTGDDGSIVQEAPSAKRCIKTHSYLHTGGKPARYARKHRTPKGALRPRRTHLILFDLVVRKHRAPQSLACNSLSTHFNNRRKPQNIAVTISNLEELPPNCMRYLRAAIYNMRHRRIETQSRHGADCDCAEQALRPTDDVHPERHLLSILHMETRPGVHTSSCSRR